jgi:flagellar protein FlbD
MIQLTRINHAPIILNCDLIEHIEVTPDTVISLVTGQKLRVLESPDEVVDRVVDFRKRVCEGRPPCGSAAPVLFRPVEDDAADSGETEATES